MLDMAMTDMAILDKDDGQHALCRLLSLLLPCLSVTTGQLVT